MPVIHSNFSLLKSKLSSYEPIKIAKRIEVNSTVVIALNRLAFDPSLPILKDKYFKRAAPRKGRNPTQERHHSAEKSHKTHDEGRNKDQDKTNPKGEDKDQLINERETEDVGVVPEGNIEEDKEDTHENRLESEDKEQEEEQRGDNGDNLNSENVACRSDIDQLVLKGPEDDEFRQYSDDEEEETALSKNLKKIRTEPLKATNPPNVQKPQTISKPMVSEPPKAPAPPPPKLQVADINRLLDQKNLHLVFAELNQQKEAFKADEAARSTLKRSVFSCIERDDSFALLRFLGLIFEYNYLSDNKFWDELIGKLKRKDNPHAKCLTFKCDVEPTLVLRNYQLTVRRIAEYFEAFNPTLTLPWHTFRYLSNSLHKTTGPNIKSLQENLKPSNTSNAQTERDISMYKDSDGQIKFKVKIPKRESKCNIKPSL